MRACAQPFEKLQPMAIHVRAKDRKMALKHWLVVGAAFGAQVASAMAADMAPLDRGPLAPTLDWTGVYLGADVGGAWSTVQTNGATVDASGVVGGLYAGYNWQFAPQWLVGIEGDSSWADLTVPAGSGDVNWIGTLRARVGWIPWAATTLYFTGGAAWSTVSISGVDTLPATQTKSGWVVGGGVEWALWASNWLVRAEYLNYRFTGILLGAALTGDMTINEVRAGVAYKF
jgi:outer membrane immunogenic protein